MHAAWHRQADGRRPRSLIRDVCRTATACRSSGGSEAMVDDGLDAKVPWPDMALAQHVLPFTAGTLATTPRTVLSAGVAQGHCARQGRTRCRTTFDAVVHGHPERVPARSERGPCLSSTCSKARPAFTRASRHNTVPPCVVHPSNQSCDLSAQIEGERALDEPVKKRPRPQS